MMTKFAQLLKKNSVLHFFSSVRLAVPLMLILATVVSIGTVYESWYNSEYASLLIYKSWWFTLLQCLLWINIFLSTLSRWPYRLHHLGFVITHIGLLTLLIGGFATGTWGLDGQLRIPTDQSSASVILSEPVLGYQFHDSPSAQSVVLPRSLQKQDFDRSSAANQDFKHLYWIKQFLPFTNPERVAAAAVAGEPINSAGLSFQLKSAFFNVSEWLHTQDNPIMQMGPATLSVHLGAYVLSKKDLKRKPQAEAPAKKVGKAKSSTSTSTSMKLQAIDKVSRKVLSEKNLETKPSEAWKVAGVQIQVKSVYKHAIVAQNKIEEGPATTWNPAVELVLVVNGKELREVLYQKFPDFSLTQDANLPFQLVLQGPEEGTAQALEPSQSNELPPNHPPVNSSASFAEDSAGTDMSGQAGNKVEFWIDPKSTVNNATVVLKKNGAVVGSRTLNEGESFQTPWMGMAITVASISKGGRMQTIPREIEPERGKPLPPSAVFIQLADSPDSFWLVEGTSQTVQLMGRQAEIFYGRKTFNLPFELVLKKFSKVDYPGTETPMSFESLVQVKSTNEEFVISMNEPLKRDGFTIYQSSFIDNPGQTVESIFSVNQDPGRVIKYLGSLILSIGIVLFTLMRSRWWQNRKANAKRGNS